MPADPPPGSAPALDGSPQFTLTLDATLGADALPALAPVILLFLRPDTEARVTLRLLDSDPPRLILSHEPLPDSLAEDSAIFLQALCDKLGEAWVTRRLPLPSFPQLVHPGEYDDFEIPRIDVDLSNGRRTRLAANFQGHTSTWPLQRALLHAFSLVEERLETELPDEQFHRLWNLVHGGLPLPIDPPPVSPSAGLPRSSSPPPTSSPSTPSSPPTTPPPTTPPPTTPPPTTPPPTTPPPTTPPPTTPPPTTPPPDPVSKPDIRFFLADGHGADEHLVEEGMSVTLSWRVEGEGPLNIAIQQGSTTIATHLPKQGSLPLLAPQTGRLILRAANSGGFVHRDLHLRIVPLPPDPLFGSSTPVGHTDIFGPSDPVLNADAVTENEGYFVINLAPAGGIPALQRGWRARVYYPATQTGPDVPWAQSSGPFPVIVYAHGRLHLANSPDNHRQATFLADHLVGQGYVVVSVDLSQVDDLVTYNIPQRTDLLDAAIEHVLALNQQSGSPLFEKLDVQRIGLAGHSRGGETVVNLARRNRLRPEGERLAIGAVMTLSPTDSLNLAHAEEPLLVLYGTADGDNLIAQPVVLYDRATSWKKKVIVYGANHFHWTDHSTLAGDTASITRAQCHSFAKGYAAAFFDRFLQDVEGHEFSLRENHGLGMIDGIPYFGAFHDPEHLTLHDYEGSQSSLSPNAFGEPVATSSGEFQKRTLPHFAHPDIVPHHTTGLQVRDSHEQAQYQEHLPVDQDFSRYRYLSLRALQLLDDPLNAPNSSQDFSLELVDAHFQQARVPLSADFAIPPADRPAQGLAQFFIKSFLLSHRIPLNAFLESEPQLDLSRLRLIRFIFDQTPTSALVIDDLRFTD